MKKAEKWSFFVDIKSGLKSFRLRTNFNQEDLAKALGINQQNIFFVGSWQRSLFLFGFEEVT